MSGKACHTNAAKFAAFAMRSRSPCSRPRACTASSAYSAGLRVASIGAATNMVGMPCRYRTAIVARARASVPLAYCADPGAAMNEADLSQEHGFRMRGAQPTRIDAFVDAAFAFAVTLLIVSVGHVPSTVPDLIQAMRGVPAFLASFLLLARFWLSHRHWSRCYGLEDDPSVRLSLTLVFVVLIYVYPLRMVANMTLAMLSGGTLAEQSIEIHTLADLR